MKVDISDVSSVKKKFKIEVSADEVSASITEAYLEIGKTAKVKGFRAGNIPEAVLEKHFRAQMEEQVVEPLMKENYFKSLDQEKIQPISDPEILSKSDIQKDSPFTYELTIEVMPVVEPKDYLGLAVEKDAFCLDENLVDERLQELRESYATFEPSSRATAHTGDQAVIGFDGFMDGKVLEGATAKKHPLLLGGRNFIPGFDEHIAGMQRDEEKEFEIQFPGNYANKALAGKLVSFQVKLHEINEKVLPPLDDQFAQKLEVDNLQVLRDDLLEELKWYEENRIDSELRKKIALELVQINPLEAPEVLISGHLTFMMNQYQQHLQSRGMTMESDGMDEQTFRGLYLESATNLVKSNLLIEAIGRKEGIEVDDADIEGKLTQIAMMSNEPPAKIRKQYDSPDMQKSLKLQILLEKTSSYLLEHAEITEIGG